jgi:hypothetical protein
MMKTKKPEALETAADEAAESPAKQKAELKSGAEKHKGKAILAMKLFQKQGK